MTIQFFRQYLKAGLLAIKIYWFCSVYRLQYFYWATLNLPQEEEKSPTMLKWLAKMNSILWQIFWESPHRLCGKVWQPELIWSEDSLSNQCQMLTWWVQLQVYRLWRPQESSMGGEFLWGFPGGSKGLRILVFVSYRFANIGFQNFPISTKLYKIFIVYSLIVWYHFSIPFCRH